MDSDTGNVDPGELEDLLFWVQQALQKYAGDPECPECLELVREGLGRLTPGLESAGRHDAIPLCAELLRVVTALEAGRLSWSADGAELLGRAALQLSGSADSAGQRGQGVLLLVNELRRLRGAGALITPAVVLASEQARLPAAAARPHEARDRPRTPPQPRREGPSTADPAAGLRSPAAGSGAPAAVAAPNGGAAPTMVRNAVPAAHPHQTAAGLGDLEVTALLRYDRERLETAVLAPHLSRPPAGLPEVLETAVREVQRAFANWDAKARSPAAVRAIGDRARILRTVARPVAPRLGEFAGILEQLMSALAEDGGQPGHEAVQLIEDAIGVLPPLLAEVRVARAADTPLADIVLRIEATLQGGPVDDEEPAPGADDLSGLERIRSRGQAEMARLAAAFEALDRGAAAAESAPRPATGLPVPLDLEATRERAAELAVWHQRVVDALARTAAQAQVLEGAIRQLRAGSGRVDAAVGTVRPSAATGFEEPAIVELEALQRALGNAIGDASAAVLHQQRMTRALQELLAGGPKAGGPAKT